MPRVKIFKRPCKKCGGPVIASPMNDKVKLCDGCVQSPENCTCKPVSLSPSEE